jgi:hypothetical protein
MPTSYSVLSRRKLQSLVVLEHAEKGLTVREIAVKTGFSHGKVESILLGINEKAKQELSMVITNRVALEYEKSLFLLDFCLSRCVEIDSKTADPRVSLQAISTILQISDSKARLLSDSAMIARAIQRNAIVLPPPLPHSNSPQPGDTTIEGGG